MTTNREKFLNNIQTKLGQALIPEASPEHPGTFQGYSWQADAPPEKLVQQFKQELETLSGHVHLLDDIEDIAQKILEIIRGHQAKRIIAWDNEALGLPSLREALAEGGITIVENKMSPTAADRNTKLAEMDDIVVGLTGAQGGLADTGALALISGPGRGRLASLLPPVHITVLSKKKLFPSIASFLSAHPTATADGSNLVFIAGPSRTADIEMTLSIGVHGPGEIHVIITP